MCGQICTPHARVEDLDAPCHVSSDLDKATQPRGDFGQGPRRGHGRGVWAGGWGNARGELPAPRAEVSMGVATPGALHHFPL